MSDVKIINLATGQSVIGKVVEETASTITFEHPLGIRLVSQEDGVGVALVPYDPINPEGKVKFYVAQVVSEPVDTPSNMIKAYLEQTSRIQIISALDQLEKGIR